jgi:hypothetical protein
MFTYKDLYIVSILLLFFLLNLSCKKTYECSCLKERKILHLKLPSADNNYKLDTLEFHDDTSYDSDLNIQRLGRMSYSQAVTDCNNLRYNSSDTFVYKDGTLGIKFEENKCTASIQ